MIYIPIDIEKNLTSTCNKIVIQNGITNNMPEIVFELHRKPCKYFDIGDSYGLHCYVTNTDQESVEFSGDISVLNPHRGQIMIKPDAKDFTLPGINTLTVVCETENETVSFQATVFVNSTNPSILKLYKE